MNDLKSEYKLINYVKFSERVVVLLVILQTFPTDTVYSICWCAFAFNFQSRVSETYERIHIHNIPANIVLEL